MFVYNQWLPYYNYFKCPNSNEDKEKELVKIEVESLGNKDYLECCVF